MSALNVEDAGLFLAAFLQRSLGRSFILRSAHRIGKIRYFLPRHHNFTPLVFLQCPTASRRSQSLRRLRFA